MNKYQKFLLLRTQFQITRKKTCTSITLRTWTLGLVERRLESMLVGGLAVASEIRCVCCPFDWVDSIENCAANFQTTSIHTPTKRFRFSGSHRRFYSLDFKNTQSVIRLDCKYASITLRRTNERRYTHTISWSKLSGQQQMVALLWLSQYSYLQSSLTLSIASESVRRTGQSFSMSVRCWCMRIVQIIISAAATTTISSSSSFISSRCVHSFRCSSPSVCVCIVFSSPFFHAARKHTTKMDFRPCPLFMLHCVRLCACTFGSVRVR